MDLEEYYKNDLINIRKELENMTKKQLFIKIVTTKEISKEQVTEMSNDIILNTDTSHLKIDNL